MNAHRSQVIAVAMAGLAIVGWSIVLFHKPDARATTEARGDKISSAPEFVKIADAAFKEKDEDKGAAYLSAALVLEPANRAALDLFRERAHTRFRGAIRDKDWELAQIQLAGYDSTVRTGLKGASERAAVEDLLARQRDAGAWEVELREARDAAFVAETKAIDEELPKADAARLREWEGRLKQVPLDALGDKARDETKGVAARLLSRKRQVEKERLDQALRQLAAECGKADLPLARLRELRAQAQHVHGQIVEAGLDGAEVVKAQAACEGIVTQLDQRLQVLSIREMQQIADADAVNALDVVDKVFAEIEKNYKDWTYHHCGEKLAEAEAHLSRIDRLCSLEMQRKALDRQQKIRKDALYYRTHQQKKYNLWAIGVLEDAMAEYQKNKGYFKDDKDGLKKILAESLGEVDSQYLHPVTHALFTEMFQKILSDLNNDMKVEATRAVEEAEKRPISKY